MKNENRKILSIFVIMILIAAAIAATITYSINNLEDKEKKEKLNVKIFANKLEGTAPLEIDFSSMITNYVGDIEYSWDLGNGNTTSEREPSVIYEGCGTYICNLTITDENGEKAIDSVEILSNKNRPPTVTLTINENMIERVFIPILSVLPMWPGDIQKIVNILENINPNMFGEGRLICEAQVDDPENDEVVSYEWTHIVETQLSKFRKAEQPIHTFEGNNSIKLSELYTWPMGTHVIKLVVFDSAGNKANASIEFQVEMSQKKIGRNQKVRMITSSLNAWLVYGKPFLGATLAGGVLVLWKLLGYNNFSGIKLISLLTLTLLFQLDMGDALILQARGFLEDHPRILTKVDDSLVNIQNKLRDKPPSDAINDSIDTIEILRENLGLSNIRPTISNLFPEDNAMNIPVDCKYVSIDVNDTEGDAFNVTIYGDYVNYIAYNDSINGTYNATLKTPLPDKKDIMWYVKVVDHNGKVVQSEYSFKTFIEL